MERKLAPSRKLCFPRNSLPRKQTPWCLEKATLQEMEGIPEFQNSIFILKNLISWPTLQV